MTSDHKSHKSNNKEKRLKGVTLKDACVNVEETSVSIGGSDQSFSVFL